MTIEQLKTEIEAIFGFKCSKKKLTGSMKGYFSIRPREMNEFEYETIMQLKNKYKALNQFTTFVSKNYFDIHITTLEKYESSNK